jgi:hypothetical protein
MGKENVVSFGHPDEEKQFFKLHNKFFQILPNLQLATDAAINKKKALLSKVDMLIGVFANICLDDFSAIVLLCLHGFGDQAYSLIRGMYERLVTARYLHLHPEEVDAFWSFHIVKLRKLGFDDLMQKLDPTGELLESFVKTKDGNGKKRLQDNWLTIDFVSMAQQVGLGEHIRLAYRIPLEFAHPSVHGILQWLEVRDGSFYVREKSSGESREIVLPIAHLFVIEVLRLQIEHFSLDGDEPVFQQTLNDYMDVWKK